VFDLRVFFPIPQLNWVCDEAYKARVGQSLFFVGSMCGTLLFGLLGDRIGRIRAVVLANWCGFLGDSATIFTQSLVTFSASRFVSGLAAEANAYLMYILGMLSLYSSPTYLILILHQLNSAGVRLAEDEKCGPQPDDVCVVLSGHD